MKAFEGGCRLEHGADPAPRARGFVPEKETLSQTGQQSHRPRVCEPGPGASGCHVGAAADQFGRRVA